jgi:hypothetical protein
LSDAAAVVDAMAIGKQLLTGGGSFQLNQPECETYSLVGAISLEMLLH